MSSRGETVTPALLRDWALPAVGGSITDEHRLVCTLGQDEIRIASCRYHYQD